MFFMKGNPKNKIKAFTLSEMLVVLLLTVIVVGLAFAILNLVQRQMLGIQKAYDNKTENNQLKQALWIDFNSYSQIQWISESGELKFDGELKQTAYSFKQGYILKDRDTFYTDLIIKELYFKGSKVDEGSIDALELSISSNEGNAGLFFFKKNSAENFMK